MIIYLKKVFSKLTPCNSFGVSCLGIIRYKTLIVKPKWKGPPVQGLGVDGRSVFTWLGEDNAHKNYQSR